MGYRCKTEINFSVFAEIPKIDIIKLFPLISYNGQWGTEAAYNVLFDKVGGLFFSYPGESFSFYSPGEVVYCHYCMFSLA